VRLDNKTVRLVTMEFTSGNACAAFEFREINLLKIKLFSLFNLYLFDRL